MRMKVLRLVVAAGLGGVVVAGVGSGAAWAGQGVSPDRQGWWSEAQQAPVPVPVTSVSGSDLQVGNAPAGPTAVAAVHYTVPATVNGSQADPSTASGTLTLQLDSSKSAGTPAIVACPSISPWQPAQGGLWNTRPNSSCATSAAGKVNADSITITFALPSSIQVSPGVFDLVLQPAPGSTAPFTANLLPAGPGSLVVEPGSSVGTAEPSANSQLPLVASLPGTAAAPAAVGSGSGAAASGGDEQALSVPSGPDLGASSPSAGSASQGAPATGSASSPLGGPAAVTTGSPASLLRRPDKRGERIMAVGLLLAMALVLWWFGGAPARAPRSLGRMGERQPAEPARRKMGGIGRFARARAAPATRL
jgi:hypothetical protein